MIENELHEYLVKRYGEWESIRILNDNGKTISLKIDFGDDEVMTVVINRRKGDNGHYRVAVEG